MDSDICGLGAQLCTLLAVRRWAGYSTSLGPTSWCNIGSIMGQSANVQEEDWPACLHSLRMAIIYMHPLPEALSGSSLSECLLFPERTEAKGVKQCVESPRWGTSQRSSG